ncbi:MAG: GatB/YqeY domain-containing protein [Chloroflexi bacterium]|nr:GatB/YqeY domain-containing protein [Chloroflexota bacterium]
MSLEEELGEDLHQAVRARDTIRRDTIRQLRAALHNEAIARGRNLAPEESSAVVRRLVNQHKDSIAEFTKASRGELVAKEEAELAILASYLPQELGPEEISVAARAAIRSVGATGRQDTGKVMRELSGQLRGKADMRLVHAIVQELLA